MFITRTNQSGLSPYRDGALNHGIVSLPSCRPDGLLSLQWPNYVRIDNLPEVYDTLLRASVTLPLIYRSYSEPTYLYLSMPLGIIPMLTCAWCILCSLFERPSSYLPGLYQTQEANQRPSVTQAANSLLDADGQWIGRF